VRDQERNRRKIQTGGTQRPKKKNSVLHLSERGEEGELPPAETNRVRYGHALGLLGGKQSETYEEKARQQIGKEKGGRKV